MQLNNRKEFFKKLARNNSASGDNVCDESEDHNSSQNEADTPPIERDSSSASLADEVNRDRSRKRDWLHVRVFLPRESIVTTLRYNNPHFETIVNSGVCLMITMCLYDIIKNSYDHGRFYLDLDGYFFTFGTFPKTVLTLSLWVVMFGACIMVQPLFVLWQKVRPALPLLADIVFASLYTVYNIAAHIAVISAIINLDLPLGLSLFLSVEQIRISMKTYSFVRENARKVIKPWKEDDKEGPAVWYQGQMTLQVGSISQYLYFLFVPSLLYRDNYPRTPAVNFKRAAQYLFEFVGLILVSIMASKNFIRPAFEALPSDPPRYLTMSLLGLMCLGLFHLFTAQGSILHAWMNFHAELTRFADRHFYEDWWTCTDFQTFYRKWNYVVYDWIHAYIYKDIKKFTKKGPLKRLPVILSMVISSLFHEYIIAVALKYFIPFLSIEFVLFGGIFYFLRPVVFGRRIWNTIFLFALSLGSAMMVWVYAVEFYSRVYCPKTGSWRNAVIPRSYECFLKDIIGAS